MQGHAEPSSRPIPAQLSRRQSQRRISFLISGKHRSSSNTSTEEHDGASAGAPAVTHAADAHRQQSQSLSLEQSLSITSPEAGGASKCMSPCDSAALKVDGQQQPAQSAAAATTAVSSPPAAAAAAAGAAVADAQSPSSENAKRESALQPQSPAAAAADTRSSLRKEPQPPSGGKLVRGTRSSIVQGLSSITNMAIGGPSAVNSPPPVAGGSTTRSQSQAPAAGGSGGADAAVATAPIISRHSTNQSVKNRRPQTKDRSKGAAKLHRKSTGVMNKRGAQGHQQVDEAPLSLTSPPPLKAPLSHTISGPGQQAQSSAAPKEDPLQQQQQLPPLSQTNDPLFDGLVQLVLDVLSGARDLSAHFSWLRVVIMFANSTDFLCAHSPTCCSSNCYALQQRTCRRLMSALKRIYEADAEDAGERQSSAGEPGVQQSAAAAASGATTAAAAAAHHPAESRGTGGNALLSLSDVTRQSKPFSLSPFHRLALSKQRTPKLGRIESTPLLSRLSSGRAKSPFSALVSGGAVIPLNHSMPSLVPERADRDVKEGGSKAKGDEQSNASVTSPMLEYIENKLHNPSHSSFSLLTKCSLLLSSDYYEEIVPIAWELLLESDPDVASAAGAFMHLRVHVYIMHSEAGEEDISFLLPVSPSCTVYCTVYCCSLLKISHTH